MGETVEKAEKSRTRTYGPPSTFQLSKEENIQELLSKKKNGSKQSKQESLKNNKKKTTTMTTLTQLDDRFKPVHRMLKIM